MATVVARMQKRTTPRSAAAAVTDSSRNPAARSTRSSGDASHYTPLEGAPPPPRRTGRATKEKTVVAITTTRKPRPSSRTSKSATTPTKRTASSTATARPNKRKRPSLPTPEPESDDQEMAASHSTEEDSDDDDDVELVGTSTSSTPPARKRAQRTAILPLPSPASTPSKNWSVSVDSTSKFAPKLTSPLKPKPRRTAPASSDLDDDEQEEESEHGTRGNEDADAVFFGPSSSATTVTTPRKSSSTSKTTPTRSASRRSNTPSSSSRSSSRIQHLPPAIVDIKNAPASLRSRLVGFHMEDEGYGAAKTRDEQDEASSSSSGHESADEAGEEEARRQERRKAKGKDRMMDEDEEDAVLPILPRPSAFGGNGLDEHGHEDEEMGEDDLALPTPPPQFSYHETVVPSSSSEPTSISTATARPDLRTVRRHPLAAAAATSNQAYLSSPLRAHLLSSLAVLSGSRLPSLPHTTCEEPRAQGSIVGLPCLEGGYDEWERPLRSALEECVTKGMGNAVMLLGPRGVGKTMLVERSLKLLSHVHGADSFVAVRLSGLVHTTDRLAMRAIAVQLAAQGFSTGPKDGEVDEGDYSSNSATMSTLLRLLEPSSASTASTEASTSTSTEAPAPAILTSKPLVIVVDEFDLFAQHPRQSFLYCLLDIVQGNRRRGGVAVIGISARVDCLSLLEKRVRSRCQSHVLQMIPPSSFTAFCELGKRLLRTAAADEAAEWTTAWNAEVEAFFAEKKVVDYMRRLWSIHGNVPTELRSALSHLLYRLDYELRNYGLAESAAAPRLSFDMLKPQPKGEEKARDDVLKQLSLSELTVLIAAKHLTSSTLDRHAGFNFEMLYDAYMAHSRRVAASTSSSFAITHKPLSKPAMRAAFDSLRGHELLLARTSSSSSSNAGTTASAGGGMAVVVPSSATYLSPVARDPWKMYRLTTWVREVDREVEARGAECPLALRRWCKNWLD